MNIQEQYLAALQGADPTVSASGTATAPTATGADIAATTALAAGEYDVEVTVAMTGTAETLVRNLELTIGAGGDIAPRYTNLLSVPGTNKYRFKKLPVAAGQLIAVRAAANATGGAIYTAQIDALRVA